MLLKDLHFNNHLNFDFWDTLKQNKQNTEHAHYDLGEKYMNYWSDTKLCLSPTGAFRKNN